jgi:hypothetical protein
MLKFASPGARTWATVPFWGADGPYGLTHRDEDAADAKSRDRLSDQQDPALNHDCPFQLITVPLKRPRGYQRRRGSSVRFGLALVNFQTATICRHTAPARSRTRRDLNVLFDGPRCRCIAEG